MDAQAQMLGLAGELQAEATVLGGDYGAVQIQPTIISKTSGPVKIEYNIVNGLNGDVVGVTQILGLVQDHSRPQVLLLLLEVRQLVLTL
jgi:hypothetical protein